MTPSPQRPRRRMRAGARWPRPVAVVSVLVAAATAVSLVAGSATAQAASPEVAFPAQVESLISPFAARVAESFHVAAETTAVMTVAATPPEPEFYCPAPGSQFINSWGFTRSGGRRHKGVDMMAPHGSPVIAPASGYVRPSNSRLGGLGFYLDAEDGTMYFGSHLQTLTTTGWVEAGTQIGTVGSTGNASPSGPHLHFEVHPGGGLAVNPYPYAAAWCD